MMDVTFVEWFADSDGQIGHCILPCTAFDDPGECVDAYGVEWFVDDDGHFRPCYVDLN